MQVDLWVSSDLCVFQTDIRGRDGGQQMISHAGIGGRLKLSIKLILGDVLTKCSKPSPNKGLSTVFYVDADERCLCNLTRILNGQLTKGNSMSRSEEAEGYI